MNCFFAIICTSIAGKKECFVDWKTVQCQKLVPVDLKCGHRGERKCCQNVNAVLCAEICARVRGCGHVCHGHQCFEHDSKQCVDCVRIERERMKKQLEAEEKQRQANKLRVNEQIKKVQKEAQLYQGVYLFASYFNSFAYGFIL